MKAKTLSIIIPVYNAEKYIENLLGKLEVQINDQIEIILIDDGSKDKSLKICRGFSNRNESFRVLHQENQGASAARNQGIKMAEGKYIVFVDSDDDISSAFISTLCTLCVENVADIMQLDSYIITSNGSEYRKVQLPDGNINISKYCDFILEQKANTLWDKIYKTEIVKNNQIYFDVNMVMGEDLAFTLDVLEHVESVYVKHNAVYKYKKNEGGLCSNVSDEYLNDLDMLYERIDDFIKIKNLNKDACEIARQSMLESVFRAVGLAVGNGYSKKIIGQRLKNSDRLQRLLKNRYNNSLLEIRRILLKNRYFSLIALLVKLKQS